MVISIEGNDKDTVKQGKRKQIKRALKRFIKRNKNNELESEAVIIDKRQPQAVSSLVRTPTIFSPDHRIMQSCQCIDPRPLFTPPPLTKIGNGRTGAIFKGSCALFGKKCMIAIKEVKVSPITTSVLINELTALNAIKKSAHPNLLSLLAAYCFPSSGADYKVWMVTELAEYGSLFALIDKIKLTEEQMSVICRQIFNGLLVLHEQIGWVHRDIKTDNILIDKNGRIIICDYGGSCKSSHAHDAFSQGDRVGTPHWMSPEMAISAQWSEKTDVWGVGIVLHEMVTGDPPGWPLSQQDVMVAIANGAIELNERIYEMSGQLVDFMLRVLQRPVESRWTVKDALSHPFITDYLASPPQVIHTALKKLSLMSPQSCE